MKTVYLDNSATTRVCETAKSNVLYAMENSWYNPSSLYEPGMNSERLIEKARVATAARLHAEPEEIFFTGCGTESNNTALFSAARHGKKRGNRIVTTAIEHPSVARVCDRLEQEGFEVVRLAVGENGKINVDELKSAINEKTILVSIMAVNNETGAIMPLEAVRPAIVAANAPAVFHSDAVQGFGKIKIDVKRLGIDLLSISGHKLHAPKGIGVLYKSKKLHLDPFMLGGGQEKGLRSGTQSVELIHAFAGALEELGREEERLGCISELQAYLKERLSAFGGIQINSPVDALPYILNFSIEGIRSEILLHFLEARGVYVSSGSACSKGGPSSVLGAMGIPRLRADSAIRVSLSRYNTREDIDALIEGLDAAIKRLKRR